MPEGQFIESAEMNYFVDVEIAASEVFVHSKTRQEWSAVAGQRRVDSIQSTASVKQLDQVKLARTYKPWPTLRS